ncbi:putative zeaxanthin epoxidase [Helianthus anomalus]
MIRGNVLNETWSDGKRGFIEGTTDKVETNSDEAKLKVKFYVPPFLPLIPVTGGLGCCILMKIIIMLSLVNRLRRIYGYYDG